MATAVQMNKKDANAALSDWRAHLSHRAHATRAALLAGSAPAALADSAAPSPLGLAGFSPEAARAAEQLVDRFAMGWALSEQMQGADAVSLADFEQQLAVILSGIAASHGGAAEAGVDDRLSRFQSQLWRFLRDARESANISFARTVHINELDRRILLLLHAHGDLTLAAISMGNGVDKAQVSRAIKRMNEVSLVTRGGIRSPIRLSPGGRQLAERLQRQAELRNRELTYGISDEQLKTLADVLDTLLARAMALFEQERKLNASNQRQEPVDFQDLVDEGLPDENGVMLDRSRVLPPFITLCSYMLRGGALAHKRSTGLSNFESWVLTEICRNPPISWPQLVVALYRDQSQAGRTVNQLMKDGLVERTGRPGRRHGFFEPSAEGRRINDIIQETSERRSEYLFQDIAAAQLESFLATFAALEHNAAVQLARERAIQEMERGQ